MICLFISLETYGAHVKREPQARSPVGEGVRARQSRMYHVPRSAKVDLMEVMLRNW